MNEDNENFLVNPLSKFFKSLIPKAQKDTEEDLLNNSTTTSEDQLYSLLKYGQNAGKATGYVNNQISFDQVFRSKADKIKKFREMEDFPEINDALDIVSDEAIVKDVDGNIVNFHIDDEEEFPSNIIDQIKEESDYLIKNVFKVQKRGWQLFRRFLVEGEIYLEKIPNKEKDSIIGLKVMPAFKTIPIYDSNIIKGFVHETIDPDKQYTADDIKLNSNQVAYVCWDGYINGDITDPKSYLWSSIRTYNQLKNLEDSLIVYRLSRALEKRVFNVEIGQMPPGKAREFINKLINQYKKNTGYDPVSGQINSQQNLMSFNEDFWFDQRDGKGSSVTTLQSGMNLGELRDIDYFAKKLYQTLKLPKSWWSDDKSPFGNGKNGEISREEIKFDMFVERIQARFSDLFIDVLITQLKLKGVDEEWLDPGKFHYKFTKANYFAEFQSFSLEETKLALLSNSSGLVYSPMNAQGMLSSEYVLKKIYKMTDEEFIENQKLLQSEKAKNPPLDPFGGMNPDGSPNNNFGSGNDDKKPKFNDFNDDLTNKKDFGRTIEKPGKKKPKKKDDKDTQVKEKLMDEEVL